MKEERKWENEREGSCAQVRDKKGSEVAEGKRSREREGRWAVGGKCVRARVVVGMMKHAISRKRRNSREAQSVQGPRCPGIRARTANEAKGKWRR